MDAVDTKARNTDSNVKKVKEGSERTLKDVFSKAVSTVQRIESIVMRALNFAGVSLNQVAGATIGLVTQAVSTLVPILAAQEFSGWMAVQATLGLIAIGQGVMQLGRLAQEQQKAGLSLQQPLFIMNQNIGRLNW